MVDVTGCVWTESMHIRIRIRILLSVAFSLASLICSSSANTPSASDRYIFVQSRRTWHDANSLCQTTYNSTLATIITDGDLLAAKQAAADHVHNKVWIGLTDHDLYSSESQWIWIDHTPCDYAVNNDCMNDRHWAASDPNDQGELGEDCGVLSMDTLSFYDWYCSDLFMFLCNNPLRTRSSIDSPDDTDTDDQQSPTGAAFHVLGEHGQYVVFNESFATASWSEANQLCQSTLQSSLATIGTDEQFEAVIQAFDYTQNSSTALWIGLYSNHTTQQYQWRTNLTTLCDHNDTHWMEGQPDTAGSQFKLWRTSPIPKQRRSALRLRDDTVYEPRAARRSLQRQAHARHATDANADGIQLERERKASQAHEDRHGGGHDLGHHGVSGAVRGDYGGGVALPWTAQKARRHRHGEARQQEFDGELVSIVAGIASAAHAQADGGDRQGPQQRQFVVALQGE